MSFLINDYLKPQKYYYIGQTLEYKDTKEIEKYFLMAWGWFANYLDCSFIKNKNGKYLLFRTKEEAKDYINPLIEETAGKYNMYKSKFYFKKSCNEIYKLEGEDTILNIFICDIEFESDYKRINILDKKRHGSRFSNKFFK